jgi:multiple sugar transport system ATP-binding protein
MNNIALDNLHKTFPNGTRAVRGCSLKIEDGEFLVLLGPSGCGKTTTLRMIAGLERPTAGRVLIGDRDVTADRPGERDIGFVFQFYALYPHMSVRDNILFPLRAVGMPRAERDASLDRVSERLAITHLLDRKPRHLSGGDRQRVALGRAMIRKPAVYLMDEPLGTLDAGLRLEMREFIRGQQLDLKITTVYVTHDQEEAMSMADRIVVMDEGRIRQIGTSAQIYDRPQDLFVANFVGSPGMNLLKGEIADATRGEFHPQNVATALPCASAYPPGPATLGIRPEHVAINPDGAISGTVVMNEYMGSTRFVHFDTTAGRLVARVLPDVDVNIGDAIRLTCDPKSCRLFDSDGSAMNIKA